VPYYEQIVRYVRSLIAEKKLRSGELFYSEGQLAKMLGISKMPVRQAFQRLRTEGLLVIRHGKGPIIGEGPVPWNFRELHGFSEEMRSRGLVPSGQLLEMRRQSPDSEVLAALRLGPGDQIYFLKRVRLANNEPVALVTSYLPVQLFPDLEKQDVAGQSLYHIIEQTYRMSLMRAEEVIGATTVGREDAQTLHTVAGSPVLHIKETTFDTEQRAVEFSTSLLRGDRYTVSVVSERSR
jgi:GntR family transcriptional regulator